MFRNHKNSVDNKGTWNIKKRFWWQEYCLIIKGQNKQRNGQDILARQKIDKKFILDKEEPGQFNVVF